MNKFLASMQEHSGLQEPSEHFIPSNIRWLLQSMISPRPMTGKDISPNEMKVLSRAYANSLNRVSGMPDDRKQSIQSEIVRLRKLPPEQMVMGTDGVMAPAQEHLALKKGFLSNSLQYPDYPPMKVPGSGIDATSMMKNITDPSYSMATTIGRANYKTDNLGNVHVVDTYDFPGKNPETSLSEKLIDAVKRRGFGLGIPEAIGAHFSKDMPVDIQLPRMP